MLTIQTNARRNAGVLYHFTTSWNNLFNILQTGELTPGPVPEPHAQKSKKFKDKDVSYFASTTRTPSTIYNASSSWRYGVVLDGAKLSDNALLRPYDYNFSPREFSVFVSNAGPYWTYFVDIDMSNREHRISDGDLEAFIDFFYDCENDKRFDCNEEPGLYQLSFTLGDGTKKTVSQSELPPCLIRMMKTSGFESEERVFSPEGKSINIAPAIMGILIPDIELYDPGCIRIQETYPNLPVYLYRDPYCSAKSDRYQHFKEEAEKYDPDYKQMYKLPIA